jgi:hypothetical protein
METRPWPEDGATEIEKALLRAGRTEIPRKGSDQRILAMIQGSSLGSPQGLSAPLLKPGALLRWMKVGLVAVVAGGAAMVAYQLSRTRDVPPSATPTVSEIPGTMPSVSPNLAAAREERPLSVPGEGIARGRRAIGASLPREAPQRPSDSYSLGDETRALDRAREAMDAHRPSEVMRLLDEYHRRFQQGRLKPEAMILRLAALVQAGGHQAAESLARQLLSDETYASYAPRIQSLLREAKQ